MPHDRRQFRHYNQSQCSGEAVELEMREQANHAVKSALETESELMQD